MGLGDFDVEQAVVLGLVFGHEDARGLLLVPSFQALLLVGFGVVGVKTRPSLEHAIAIFHMIFWNIFLFAREPIGPRRHPSAPVSPCRVAARCVSVGKIRVC